MRWFLVNTILFMVLGLPACDEVDEPPCEPTEPEDMICSEQTGKCYCFPSEE